KARTVLTCARPSGVWCLSRDTGRVVKFTCATGGALSNYRAKYVAKPGVGLDAWPSRTRWAQTIIPVVPRQVPRGTPEPLGWLVERFPRFATERAVRVCFDM